MFFQLCTLSVVVFEGILGIFAQMYEKMIQEHNFFLCTVCYKNGNEIGSDLVLIVGVLSYGVFTDLFLKQWLFFLSFFLTETQG